MSSSSCIRTTATALAAAWNRRERARDAVSSAAFAARAPRRGSVCAPSTSATSKDDAASFADSIEVRPSSSVGATETV